MSDIIVSVWVGAILFAAVFFSSLSVIHLFQNKRIGIDKGFFFSLSACFVAVILCLSIWPPVHRVYNDEFAFISQSVNLVASGKASIILKGSLLRPEEFVAWTANPKLPGFAWLEAVILFFTKDFENGYFILNIVLGALATAAVYRIAWLLTSSHAVAWWSAIFWACLPARITYSMSAASDIAGAFFFFLFLLFINEYKTLKAQRILYAALFCGVYSICIKPFYGIFVPVGLGIALHVYRRSGLLEEKLCKRILLDIVCLFLPILSAIPVMFTADTRAGAYSVSFIFKNLGTSVDYLFNSEQNTLLTSLAALIAAGRSFFFSKEKLVNGLAGWFLVVFLMFSVFKSGGISYPGNAYSDRYFLFIAFPFVFLAAKGTVDSVTKAHPVFLGTLFFVMLVASAFFASSHLTAAAKEGFHNHKTLLIKQAFSFVPEEAYLLDGCAALTTTLSPKKSIQLELFLNGDRPEKVVFLKAMLNNFFSSDEPQKTALVENILNTQYRCKPLTDAPLQKAYLAATPVLCTRKDDK